MHVQDVRTWHVRTWARGTSHVARRTCLALFVAAALVPPAAAQERLTLEEAIARAMKESARLAEIEARQAGAAAAEAGRGAAGMPVVSLQGGYTRTAHVEEFAVRSLGQLQVIYPDVPDNLRARLDLQWPIYTGGRVGALTRAARAEKEALAGDLAAARADLRLEVTRAYWALVTAIESERVVGRALERLDVHLGDLRVRLEQGLIPPSDVTSMEAQRARQQLLSIESRNLRQIAEADLRRLTGSPGPLAPQLGTATASGDSHSYRGQPPLAVAVPDGGRPERVALQGRIAAAEAREDAADAGRLPQVAAIAGYDYARPNPRIFPRAAQWDDFWEAGVNVTWTLWDGGRRAAERAEASAATRAAQARLTEFDRLAAFEVEQRQFELDSARAAIVAADEGIRSAAETLRVIGERYKQGVATTTDVLDAEVALLQADLDRTRATASARLAEARLERARGGR